MFFAECARFSEDNRALFLCFPRSLEGIAAKWYAEHVNPIELRDFDKVVNMFVERFLFNTEALPTLNHLCNLKQEPNEKARDFIHKWRSLCNKMRNPISEEHALQVILNNFSQPLKSLLFPYPSKSFIELTERAEWLEMGVENGMYEGVALAKNIPDPKKKAHFTYSAEVPGDDQGSSSKHGSGSGTKPEQNRGRKGKFFKNNDKPLPAGPQQKGDLQEKPKHINWSRDRKFTPLDQPLEKILEYLLSHGMVKLPKVADPPVLMGRFKEQYCKFHRAMGHDTEYCFVLKHLIQDCIDKSILIEDEEEGKMDILSAPFPKHSASTISEHSFLPQNHIRPCSGEEISLQHQVMVLHQDQPAFQRGDILSFLISETCQLRMEKSKFFQRDF